ncbi:MAG: hypothetical protein RL094_626 [Candidatus Parcubacteria bacterium]|jgi:hypothetical protein
MDQDIKEIRVELKKLAQMTEDNNAMLHSIQRRARMSFLFMILKWLVVLGLTIGAFYYIQPFLEKIAAIYQQVSGTKVDFLHLLKLMK